MDQTIHLRRTPHSITQHHPDNPDGSMIFRVQVVAGRNIKKIMDLLAGFFH
jgi:hypothetical protein